MGLTVLFLREAIEDDYVGPQLEDGKVTLKFMEELMEFYKDQKKLHRKFAYKVALANAPTTFPFSTQNTFRSCAISTPISASSHR